MISGIRSIKKTVSKLTKTVEYLTIPSSPKSDQLSSYRDDNDKENFQDEIVSILNNQFFCFILVYYYLKAME
ncbi:unnamed protein product, partial [Rotaria magnacalcarata]